MSPPASIAVAACPHRSATCLWSADRFCGNPPLPPPFGTSRAACPAPWPAAASSWPAAAPATRNWRSGSTSIQPRNRLKWRNPPRRLRRLPRPLRRSCCRPIRGCRARSVTTRPPLPHSRGSEKEVALDRGRPLPYGRGSEKEVALDRGRPLPYGRGSEKEVALDRGRPLPYGRGSEKEVALDRGQPLPH